MENNGGRCDNDPEERVMVVLVLALIASMVPSVIIYLLLRRRTREVDKALVWGMLGFLPVVVLALILNIIGNLAGMKSLGPIARSAYTSFILHSFVEELVKYSILILIVRKARTDLSVYDITAIMVVVGLGFGLPEDVLYLIGSDVVQILIRGILVMHGGLAYITGRLYARTVETGKKVHAAIGFIIPFLLHGFYDFGLTPELLEKDDNYALISVGLAFLDLILMIILIVFFIRARNKEKYTRIILKGPAVKTAGENG